MGVIVEGQAGEDFGANLLGRAPPSASDGRCLGAPAWEGEVMARIDDERAGHEARDSVAAQPPAVGENRVQAAMRRYLGAAAWRDRAPRRRPKAPQDGADPR